MSHLLYLLESIVSLSSKKKFYTIILLVIVSFSLPLLEFILNYFFFSEYMTPVTDINKFNILSNFKNTLFLPTLIYYSINILIEDILYRAPISFIFIKRYTNRFLLYFILISNLVFALSHLHYFDNQEFLITIPSIFIGGIIYSIIYILAGGKDSRILKPLFFVFTLHLTFDLIIFAFFGLPFNLN